MRVETSSGVQFLSSTILFTKRMFAHENGRHGNAGVCLLIADETHGAGIRCSRVAPGLGQELVEEVGFFPGFGEAFKSEARGNAVALPVSAYVPYAPAESLGEWVAINPKGV